MQAREAERAWKARQVDLRFLYRAREQDLNFRRLERLHRRVDDVRRRVDKHTEQLKAVSSLAALVAGFEMVVLVESNVEVVGLNENLVALFASLTALVIVLNVISMVTASLILVRILNFDEVGSVLDSGRAKFADEWARHDEKHWRVSYMSFFYSIPPFLLSLALVGWVRFEESRTTYSIVASIAVGGLLVFLFHTFRFYRRLDEMHRPHQDDDDEARGAASAGVRQAWGDGFGDANINDVERAIAGDDGSGVPGVASSAFDEADGEGPVAVSVGDAAEYGPGHQDSSEPVRGSGPPVTTPVVSSTGSPRVEPSGFFSLFRGSRADDEGASAEPRGGVHNEGGSGGGASLPRGEDPRADGVRADAGRGATAEGHRRPRPWDRFRT